MSRYIVSVNASRIGSLMVLDIALAYAAGAWSMRGLTRETVEVTIRDCESTDLYFWRNGFITSPLYARPSDP